MALERLGVAGKLEHVLSEAVPLLEFDELGGNGSPGISRQEALKSTLLNSNGQCSLEQFYGDSQSSAKGQRHIMQGRMDLTSVPLIWLGTRGECRSWKKNSQRGCCAK